MTRPRRPRERVVWLVEHVNGGFMDGVTTSRERALEECAYFNGGSDVKMWRVVRAVVAPGKKRTSR